jgi:hypothetical protein
MTLQPLRASLQHAVLALDHSFEHLERTRHILTLIDRSLRDHHDEPETTTHIIPTNTLAPAPLETPNHSRPILDPMNDALAALCDTCSMALRRADNPLPITFAASLLTKITDTLDWTCDHDTDHKHEKEPPPCPKNDPSE